MVAGSAVIAFHQFNWPQQQSHRIGSDMNSHWNHVLAMLLLCTEVILKANGTGGQQHSTANCHIVDRSGRRCQSSGSANQYGSNRYVHSHSSSPLDNDEEGGSRSHRDKSSSTHSSKHSSNERLLPLNSGKKANNGTRMDSWPGHSLSANNSWNALSNLNNNHNYELTTEVTTTESSNDIERFLVGRRRRRRRRRRSSLWMNPTLLYSRTITHSMSGNANNHGHNEEEEEESESDEESNEHGSHSGSESSRAVAVSRQVVHERTSAGGGHGGGHGGSLLSGGSHSSTSHSSSSGSGHGSNHSNRTPLFLVPRTTNTGRMAM